MTEGIYVCDLVRHQMSGELYVLRYWESECGHDSRLVAVYGPLHYQDLELPDELSLYDPAMHAMIRERIQRVGEQGTHDPVDIAWALSQRWIRVFLDGA